MMKKMRCILSFKDRQTYNVAITIKRGNYDNEQGEFCQATWRKINPHLSLLPLRCTAMCPYF